MDDGRDGLEARVRAVEADLGKLAELVDGQADWSHRKRLHKIESDDRGVAVAAEALRAYRENRDSFYTRVREWGAFVLAGVAIYLNFSPH